MFKKLHKINRFLGLVMIFYACNTAKRVPEGKALLQENYILGVKREWREQLQGQIKQQPNRRVLFGSTKFYLLVYNIFDTTQHKNWLNKRVIRIGEEPVIYDSASNYMSVQNIKQSLFNMGYFDAEVSWKDTLVGKKKNYAKVYYSIAPQQYYTIKKIRYLVEDRFLDSLIQRDIGGSYLRVDNIISTLKNFSSIFFSMSVSSVFIIPGNEKMHDQVKEK